MGFFSWLTGHSEKEADVYANFEKVEIVVEELNNISTTVVKQAEEEVKAAIQEVNSVNGVSDYVGTIQINSYDSLFESITETIQSLGKQLNDKADTIKIYSESDPFSKVLSGGAMVLSKLGEGFTSVGEGILDTAVSIVGWGAGGLGFEKFQNDIANFVKKDLSHDLFNVYYKSDFAKKSIITEDSAIAGATKIVGKTAGLMLLGSPALTAASGFGYGVEQGLKNGQSYNAAMGTGLVTGIIQGLGTVAGAHLGGTVASTAGAAAAATLLNEARLQKNKMADQQFSNKVETIIDEPKKDGIPKDGEEKTKLPEVIEDPEQKQEIPIEGGDKEIQKREVEGGGNTPGGGETTPGEQTPATIPTTTPETNPATTPNLLGTVPPTIPDTIPTTIPTTAPAQENPPGTKEAPDIPTYPRADEGGQRGRNGGYQYPNNPTTPNEEWGIKGQEDPPTEKEKIFEYEDPDNPKDGNSSHAGGAYGDDGYTYDNGVKVNELEKAETLQALEKTDEEIFDDFDETHDDELDDAATRDSAMNDVINGSKYSKIPTSTTPTNVNKKKKGSSVIPIAAGLSAAAAAGIGAKAYIDREKNNSTDDEDDEFIYEDDGFSTSEDWNGDEDTVEVNYSSNDSGEELEDDYYQDNVESYTARNQEELSDLQ